MTAEYTHQLADFAYVSAPATAPDVIVFASEVRAAGVGSLLWCEWIGSGVRSTFEQELSSQEQTDLDGLVASHTGSVPEETHFIESNQIVGSTPFAVTSQTWEDIGGQPTNAAALLATNEIDPGFVGYSRGRITCLIKVAGDGAQLKVIECDPTPRDLTSAPTDVADTGGEWVICKVLTDLPPAAGDSCFTLQGQLNGATSMEVRRAALTMLYTGP